MYKAIIIGITTALVTALLLYLAGKITQVPTVLVPSTAVVAFHAAKCPEGWKEVDYTKGRFIVGVGNSEGLTTYNLRQQGGEEKHKLTVDEMPSHQHSYDDYYYYDDEKGSPEYQTKQGDDTGTRKEEKGRKTSSSGGDMPHNNLPPYVALLFCEKN